MVSSVYSPIFGNPRYILCPQISTMIGCCYPWHWLVVLDCKQAIGRHGESSKQSVCLPTSDGYRREDYGVWIIGLGSNKWIFIRRWDYQQTIGLVSDIWESDRRDHYIITSMITLHHIMKTCSLGFLFLKSIPDFHFIPKWETTWTKQKKISLRILYHDVGIMGALDLCSMILWPLNVIVTRIWDFDFDCGWFL